jgi:hypothetical protein
MVRRRIDLNLIAVAASLGIPPPERRHVAGMPPTTLAEPEVQTTLPETPVDPVGIEWPATPIEVPMVPVASKKPLVRKSRRGCQAARAGRAWMAGRWKAAGPSGGARAG